MLITPCILIIINLLQYHFLAFNSRMFRKLQFRMPKLILFSSNGFGFRIYFRFLHQEDTITKEVCCRSYILLLVCIPGEEMFFKKSLAHIPFFRNKNMMLLQCDLEYLCHINSKHVTSFIYVNSCKYKKLYEL